MKVVLRLFPACSVYYFTLSILSLTCWLEGFFVQRAFTFELTCFDVKDILGLKDVFASYYFAIIVLLTFAFYMLSDILSKNPFFISILLLILGAKDELLSSFASCLCFSSVTNFYFLLSFSNPLS